MRILRLSTSDDLHPSVPDELRGYRIVERTVAAETGEPVETILREIWPEANLPDVVGAWLDRYEPDIVFLRVSSFWASYQSVPLKLRRSRLGAPGRALARAGFAAAEVPRVGHSRAFIAFRDAARRVIGGATYFTPEEVIERLTLTMRRVLRREGVLLIVRGGLVAETAGCPAGVVAREEEKRRRLMRRWRLPAPNCTSTTQGAGRRRRSRRC